MGNDLAAGLLFAAVVGICAFVVWLFIADENNRKSVVRDARAAYEASLSQLKDFPTNSDLKMHTLALGRTYSNLTRRQRGVTIYDEAALSNDISAACAAAAGVQSGNSAVALEMRLLKLMELKSKGIVTEDEYQAERIRILKEL